MPILAGVSVELALRRSWRRLWIVAVAAAPLAAWYLREAGNQHVDLAENMRALPGWTVRFLAGAGGAVVGLPAAPGAVVLVGAAAALVLWRRAVRPAPPWATPRAIGLATTLAVTVLVTGAARAGNTPPTSSRYLYFVPIVLLLLGTELAAGLPVPRVRLTRVAGSALVVVAAILGIQQLRDGKAFYLRSADGTAARMGALTLVDRDVAPGFPVAEPSPRLQPGVAPGIPPPLRLGAARHRGRARPRPSRVPGAADALLARALVHLARGRAAGCRVLTPGPPPTPTRPSSPRRPARRRSSCGASRIPAMAWSYRSGPRARSSCG